MTIPSPVAVVEGPKPETATEAYTPFPEYNAGDDATLDALLSTMSNPQAESPYAKILLYGNIGSGKSTLAGTAGSKILWVDSGEAGYLSLANHGLLDRVKQVMAFDSYKQLELLAEYIREGKFQGYDTLVVDTISSIISMDMDQILEAKTNALRAQARTTGRDPNAIDPVDNAEWPEYNRSAARTRRLIDSLVSLDMNVLFTSQHREDIDGISKKIMIRPWISDKSRKYVEQRVHVVAYCSTSGEAEDRQFNLQVHPTDRVEAKCRIGGMPVVMTAPPGEPINLRNLFDKWTNQMNELEGN
jgi:hypothetical protein